MENKQLTPKDALQILDEVTNGVKLDRRGHVLVLQAIEVLKKIVEEKNAGSKT